MIEKGVKSVLVDKFFIRILAGASLVMVVSATIAHESNRVVVVPLGGAEPSTKIVFLTVTAIGGRMVDVGSSGAERADELCQDEADNQLRTKVKGKKFKAWLSGGLAKGLSASGRTFNRYDLPYVLVDNTLVAENYDDLVSGNLLHPINMQVSGYQVTEQSSDLSLIHI